MPEQWQTSDQKIKDYAFKAKVLSDSGIFASSVSMLQLSGGFLEFSVRICHISDVACHHVGAASNIVNPTRSNLAQPYFPISRASAEPLDSCRDI